MKTKFQNIFGDSNRIKVLEFYLESGEIAFPIEAVVEEKNIGKSQTYEIVKDMKKKGILIEKGIYDKKKFYQLNTKEKSVYLLKKLFSEAIRK